MSDGHATTANADGYLEVEVYMTSVVVLPMLNSASPKTKIAYVRGNMTRKES